MRKVAGDFYNGSARTPWPGARDRQGAHVPCACLFENPSAGVQCRARRSHVIDENHASAMELVRADEGGNAKGRTYVAPALGGAESRLRNRRGGPPQREHHRRTEVPCERIGLVEAAAQASPWVERHGDDAIGFGEEVCAVGAHHGGKRASERLPPVVLEGVDDFAEGTIVVTSRARAVECRRLPSTPRAPPLGGGQDPPRGQRVATREAQRRQHGSHGRPAGIANGPARRRIEYTRAGAALRRQHHRQNRIDRSGNCGLEHPTLARVRLQVLDSRDPVALALLP